MFRTRRPSLRHPVWRVARPRTVRPVRTHLCAAPVLEGDLTVHLERLHDEYTYDLNAALEEGREDLALSLSDEYADEALCAITTLRRAA